MKRCCSWPLVARFGLSAVPLVFCSLILLPFCHGADATASEVVRELRKDLDTRDWIVMRRAIQKSVAHAMTNDAALGQVFETLLHSDWDDARFFGALELSRAGSRVVPRLIQELTSSKGGRQLQPLLVCLARIGLEANAAIPALTKALESPAFDEEDRIKLRIALANVGYQPPEIIQQILRDIATTNWAGSRPLEGAAVHFMAQVRVREWAKGEIARQLVGRLKDRAGTPVAAICTLAWCGKGDSNVVRALREITKAGVPEWQGRPRWDGVHLSVGFTQYLIETNDRIACLRYSLRGLGPGVIDSHIIPAFTGLLYFVMDDDMVRELIRLLDDSDQRVRAGAMFTMMCLGPSGQRATPKLLKIGTTSGDEEERWWAFKVLGALLESNRLSVLEECLRTEKSEYVRGAIEASLREIKHEPGNPSDSR